MKQSVFSMISLTLRLLYQTSVAALLIGTPGVAWGQPGESPIHEAACRGDVAKIRQLLEDDSLLVNSPAGSRGTTPLHSAIKGGQLEAAKVLLDHGADIEADVFSEGRPLQLAVEMRDRAMVRLLLERGANADGKGRTQDAPPIVKARNDPEMLKLLIEHGASVDGCDRFGGTPLIYAAASGNLRMVKMLLDEGASIDVQGSFRGGTPLDGAIRGGHLAVAQLLLQEGAWPGKTMGFPLLTDQQLKDPQVLTERLQLAVRAHRHFWAACGNGQVEKVQSFLRMFPYLAQAEDPENRKSALRHAVAGGHTEIIKLLIDHGADPNESDASEGTPLVQATKLGNLKVIQTLVENGADVNFKEIGHGPVAIHTAVESGNTEVAKFLLDHVNVEALGRSVLSIAASRGDVEMAKLLVEHGADPKLGASAYCGPLYWAVQSGSADMVGYLLDQGPSLEARRHAMHEAARLGRENTVRLIAESGVEMDAYTWLHLANTEQLEAALRKDPELLRATYGEGSSEGRTLLHIAVSLGCVEAAKVLLERGADPSARGRMWNTPLHAAALNGNLACVKLLVEHGASVNVRNRQGMTALDMVDPEKNRDLHIASDRAGELLFKSIRQFLAGKGAESGLYLPEGETRAGEIVKRPPLTGPSFQIGQWTLYPGAEYRLQSADSTILIRNADGKAYVEVLFQHGEKETKIVRDPSKKEPLILTRIAGDKEQSVSFKTTNDFRAKEPELLERFQQFEKDIYEGEVEGSWKLSGPSEAQGPLVIRGN